MSPGRGDPVRLSRSGRRTTLSRCCAAAAGRTPAGATVHGGWARVARPTRIGLSRLLSPTSLSAQPATVLPGVPRSVEITPTRRLVAPSWPSGRPGPRPVAPLIDRLLRDLAVGADAMAALPRLNHLAHLADETFQHPRCARRAGGTSWKQYSLSGETGDDGIRHAARTRARFETCTTERRPVLCGARYTSGPLHTVHRGRPRSPRQTPWRGSEVPRCRSSETPGL